MKREYAARNPFSGQPMLVPENSLENALKMVQLVKGTVVLTRTVSEWGEWNPPLGDSSTCEHCGDDGHVSCPKCEDKDE